MPLLPGKENIGHNISVEEAAGKPHDQAVAIALSTAYDANHHNSKKNRVNRHSDGENKEE